MAVPLGEESVDEGGIGGLQSVVALETGLRV